MVVSDVVVLIPGFLGFDQIGHFPYFANRVGAALRGCLFGLSGADIPVVPVKTSPTERLANRQIALLHALKQIDRRFGPVERLHLVGHSTGGVDAYLLTGQAPLEAGKTWYELDPDQVRQKIRTVISIASPHIGTCLALSPVARFFRHPLLYIDKSPGVAATLWSLGFSLHLDEMSLGALGGAVVDTGGAAAYILNVLRSRTLVDDLRPRHLVQIRRQFRRDADLANVAVRSVVTMAGKKTKDYAFGNRKPGAHRPDAFFRKMYEYTAGSGFDPVEDDCAAVELVTTAIGNALSSDKLIKNLKTKLREVCPQLNDGLVNSARQLVNPANHETELLAIVVGDHMDVVGYYPRWATVYRGQAKTKRRQLQSGILHSGSGFGDREFFALFQRIAKVIVSQTQRYSTV